MTTPAASQPTLTFPRATFARLSPHPYLLAHLESSDPSTPSTRANARTPSQARPPHIHTGSLTHADGSAVVRIGDTSVVCGVRGEILLAANAAGYRSNAIRTPGRSEAQELDLLVPNVEMATGCSPEFLPGMPPSKKAQELVARIYGLLHSSRVLESEQLRIYGAVVGEDEDENEDENGDVEEKVEVKAFWTLYIDILFISLDGNPFDAAWAAVIAALRDTKLPGTKWDQDRGMVVASNAVANAQLLKLRGPPFACSFAVFKAKESARTRGPDDKSWVLVDPDAFEEGLCDEKVTLVIDRSENKTRVVSIEKAGGVAIGREEMKSLVKSAEKRWTEWNDLLQR